VGEWEQATFPLRCRRLASYANPPCHAFLAVKSPATPTMCSIVGTAEPWSSLRGTHLTDAIPIPLPEEGTSWIDQPLVAHELTTLRTCVNRQQPFGTPEWQQQLATTLGLASTLRPRGRPARFKKPGVFSALGGNSAVPFFCPFDLVSTEEGDQTRVKEAD